jgi:PAS domain S-box-containing protein
MDANKLKILAVDDQRDNLTTLKAVLTDALPGCTLLTALDGTRGITLAQAEDPDVILLDIVMPNMDGFEVCRRLKAEDRLRDIPVIFLTALGTDRETRIKALEAGGDAFLTKPPDESELVAQLRAMAKVKLANRTQRLERDELAALVAERTRELAQNEEKYRSMLTNLEAGFYNATADGTLLDHNVAFNRILGFDPDEDLVGTRLPDFWQDPAARKPYLEELARNGFIRGYLIEAKKRGGEKFVVQASSRIVKDESSRPIRIEGTFLDVTDRVQAEKAQRRSEELLAVTLKSIADAVIATDREGCVTFMNPTAEAATGWALKEAAGKPLDEVFDIRNEETGKRIESPVKRVFREGVIVGLANHTKLTRRDGSELPIADSGAPICDEAGKIIGAVLVFQDCTDSRRAEHVLRESERSLKAAQRIGHVGSWELDVATENLTWSDEVYRIYGFEPQGFVPTYEKFLTILHPEDHERTQEQVDAALRGDTEYDIDFRFVQPDGKLGWVHCNGEVIRDEQGKPLRLVGTQVDVTERRQAEEMLRMSAEKLRLTIDHSPLGVCTVDHRGNFTEANPAYERITGYSLEELHKLTFFDITHPDDRSKNWNLFQDMSSGEKAGFKMEKKYVRKNGSVIFVAIHAEAIRDAAGKPLFGLAIVEDITERKRAEDDLRRSEAFLDSILDQSPYSMWISDEEGTLLRMNQACRDLLKFSDAEVVNKYNVREDNIVEQQGHMALVNRVYQNGEAVHFKLEYDSAKLENFDLRTPSRRFLEVNIFPIEDDSGRVTNAVVQHLDVTQRELDDAKLRQIEWLLTRDAQSSRGEFTPSYGDLSKLNTCRMIQDAVDRDLLSKVSGDYLKLLDTSGAIYETNGDYAMAMFSSSWCQFMDQASRDLCGTDDNREALTSGKWLCHESCWTECSKVSIEKGEPVDIECNGGIHLYAVPICASDRVVGSMNLGYGEPPQDPKKLRELAKKYHVTEEKLRELAEAYETRPPFFVEVAKARLRTSAQLIGEIIERRNVERELREQQQHLDKLVDNRTIELTAANKELEAFAYSVSHDLRAPLRGIDGFSKALLEDYRDKLDDTGKDYIHRVRAGTQRMGRLIDDLLKLSRLTRAEMKHQRLDLGELGTKIAEELQRDGPDRKIDFKVSPGLTARGDRPLMEVALENLLRNAWKFTGNREHAKIEFGSTDTDGERVYFVRDNGAGFDMAYADKLFGAFQRLHDTGEFPGTGIGLAIVQRVIQRHGGRVWAEGEVEKGATFYFTLPNTPPKASEGVES